jgi:hypothetical protein
MSYIIINALNSLNPMPDALRLRNRANTFLVVGALMIAFASAVLERRRMFVPPAFTLLSLPLLVHRSLS